MLQSAFSDKKNEIQNLRCDALKRTLSVFADIGIGKSVWKYEKKVVPLRSLLDKIKKTEKNDTESY